MRPLLGKRQIGSLKLGKIEGAQADIAAGKTRPGRPSARCRFEPPAVSIGFALVDDAALLGERQLPPKRRAGVFVSFALHYDCHRLMKASLADTSQPVLCRSARLAQARRRHP